MTCPVGTRICLPLGENRLSCETTRVLVFPHINCKYSTKAFAGEFVCSYCPKVFKDKQRLDNHVRVHTNERPYKCHICSKGFKTWIHRKTHLNIHLGIKKWVCKYCGKAFTNSCTLKGHEMIHTGERPHRCPECKKGFITMSAMKKHRMVHFRTTASSYGKKVIFIYKSFIKNH